MYNTFDSDILRWTMERSIGNIEEIRQDLAPYANLSQRAVERAQVTLEAGPKFKLFNSVPQINSSVD
jgi:hypothetical protein